MAATVGTAGSAGSGRLAFAHSARILPGVSWPSSVVRSTIEIARSSAHRFAVVLIDLVASTPARASAPTRSTPGSPSRKLRRSEPVLVTVVTGSPSVSAVGTPGNPNPPPAAPPRAQYLHPGDAAPPSESRRHW